MENLNRKQKIILVGILSVMLLIIVYYITKKTNQFNYSEFENIEKENIMKQEIIETENISIQKDENIILHITGAIKNEGIVSVNENSRISDVIAAAGGVTEEADLSNINLAYKVKDGQKICIPSINKQEDAEMEYISEGSGDNVIENEKEHGSKEQIVNINTANQTELETLNGIGPSTALKIINYRRENGEFKTIEDIKNVPGIGDAKFEAIKEQISV